MKKAIFFFSLILVAISVIAQNKIIVIDPGHNWDNTTTLKPIRTETEVLTNWDVANKLKGMIENNFYLDWLAILTRSDNSAGSNVTEAARALIANNYEVLAPGQVYFLSIHCNGGDGTATGTETFYCNQTFNLNNTLLIKYAQKVQDNMVEHGVWTDRSGNRNQGAVEEDNSYLGFHLAVLKTLKMPNCLSEIGFADNIADVQKLLDDGWRSKFAYAYFQALKETFADLNILSYSIINLPCYSNNSLYCKISVNVKNATDHNVSGDLKAMLRHFPIFSHEDPNSDFCQLGVNKSFFLSPTQEKTFIFDSNIPITLETGMALCIESKLYGDSDWKKVPMPDHKQMLKVPLNSAFIKGIIYNSVISPLQGAEIWSYQKPSLKSSNQTNNNDLEEPQKIGLYPLFFDPTTSVSNKKGNYDILIPSSWNDAVVSVKNYMNYSEVLVSPIEDKNFIHNYTSSPIIIGTGSGTGLSSCGSISGSPGTSYNNPKEVEGTLGKFEKITLNGQQDFALVCKNDLFTLGVFPKPVSETKIGYYACSNYPNGKPIPEYYQYSDCYLALEWKYENCNLFGSNCDFNSYLKYFVSMTKCNNNFELIGEEKTKWFITKESVFKKIEEIDLKEAFTKMNIVLQEGDIYKLKIAVAPYDKWEERSIFFLVIYEDHLFDNTILSGNYFAKNITLTNNIISSPVTLCASNIIAIKPNTSIKGSFHAYVDKKIQNYSCTNQLPSKQTNNDQTDDLDKLTLNFSEFILSKSFIENRTVSKFSNYCSCEKKQEIKNDIDLNLYPNPTTKTINFQYLGDVNQIQSIDIINSTGALMLRKTNTFSSNQEFNVTHFPPGVYCVRLVTAQKVLSKVFIKN